MVASENDRIMSRSIDLEEIDAPDLVFYEQQMKGEDVDFFFDTEVCRIVFFMKWMIFPKGVATFEPPWKVVCLNVFFRDKEHRAFPYMVANGNIEFFDVGSVGKLVATNSMSLKF